MAAVIPDLRFHNAIMASLSELRREGTDTQWLRDNSRAIRRAHADMMAERRVCRDCSEGEG